MEPREKSYSNKFEFSAQHKTYSWCAYPNLELEIVNQKDTLGNGQHRSTVILHVSISSIDQVTVEDFVLSKTPHQIGHILLEPMRNP